MQQQAIKHRTIYKVKMMDNFIKGKINIFEDELYSTYQVVYGTIQLKLVYFIYKFLHKHISA